MNSVNEEVEKKITFLKLGEELGNITQAAKIMGYHASTYYRLKKIYDLNGEDGLRKHAQKRSWLMEDEVLRVVDVFPKYGAAKISVELKEKGYNISVGAIHAILKKHNLNTSKQRINRYK